MKLQMCFIAALCVCACAAQAAETRSYAGPYARGVKALAHALPDSALMYFSLAFTEGMPRDSLLYYWGECYRAKGVLDTALALNFSIAGNDDEMLDKKYRQRYLVYSALGWHEKAEIIIDSLKKLKTYVRSRAAPNLKFSGSAGYSSIDERLAGSYPWNAMGILDTTDSEQGFGAGCGLDAAWDISLKKGRALRLGIGGAAERPYFIQDNILDSLKFDMLLGVKADVHNIFDGITLSGGFYGRRNYRGDFSAKPGADISWFYSSGNSFRALTLGYSAEISPEISTVSQSALLIGYASRNISEGNKIGAFLDARAYISDEISFSYEDIFYVHYIDDAGADFITHYTDSTYTATVDTAGKSLIVYTRELPLIADTVLLSDIHGGPVECRISQTFLQASPSVAYSHRWGKICDIDLGAGWQIQYYPSDYQWVIIGTGQEMQASGLDSNVAFSRADSTYYLLLGMIQPDGIQYFSSHDFSHVVEEYNRLFTERSAKRIDNSISVNLSLKRDVWRLGTAVLSGSIAKIWSTLPDDCPVKVPEIAWAVKLGWQKNIIPKSKLIR